MLMKSQAVLRSRAGVGAIVLLFLALVGALLVTISSPSTAESNPPFARADDKISDYGVCIGLNESACYNGDWTPTFKNNEVPRVLVFSRTGGPRHAHLGSQLGSGLNPPLNANNRAQQAIVDWGAEHGFEVDWTEDLSITGNPGTLRRYNTVVFLSNTRNFLDDASYTGIRQYIRSGGGFVSLHNTLGAEYNWDYFQGLNGGANFYDHGPNRFGTVQKVSKKDVSTKDLPNEWEFRDEWYNLEPMPSPYVRILLEVDVNPAGGTHPGHPDFHPVTWCHYFDGGRSWVTHLGHNNDAWTGEAENAAYFKEHVVGGILSTAGAEPFCK